MASTLSNKYQGAASSCTIGTHRSCRLAASFVGLGPRASGATIIERRRSAVRIAVATVASRAATYQGRRIPFATIDSIHCVARRRALTLTNCKRTLRPVRVNAYGAGTTPQLLVQAAERLFAAQGIDTPSLAAITREAGLNNTGSVHHHFGSREALLDAVIAEHQGELDDVRSAMLDEAERNSIRSPELLARIIVEPLAAKLDDERGRAFVSIQAQRSLRPRFRRPEPRPLAQRMFRMVGLAGDAPGPIARLLGEFSRDLAYSALAQRAVVEVDGGREAGVGREEFVAQLCGAVARVYRVGGGMVDKVVVGDGVVDPDGEAEQRS
jgi:AcrR family transcriptional regulator